MMADANKQNEEPDLAFEQALAEVQRIIDQMESGEVSLERSLEQYGRGMKLIQHCDKVLARAEEAFRKLTPPPPPSVEAGAEEPPAFDDIDPPDEEIPY